MTNPQVMETLEFLKAQGLIDSEGFPFPPTSPIKIVNSGVIFQQKCRNGLPYDICVSWLQKAIRLGIVEEALYCAYHISDLGKIFRSHLLNRLIVICSEDIGPAEPGLPVRIQQLYSGAKAAETAGNLAQVQRNIIEMIYMLVASRKSRITDLLIHKVELDGASASASSSESQVQVQVQQAIELCNKKVQDTNGTSVATGFKKLDVYYLWSLLEKGTKHPDDTLALLKLFDVRGKTYGLLFLVHAISLQFMSNPPQLQPLDEALAKSKSQVWEDIGKYKFPIRDSAVDMHTAWGRKQLGRGLSHFLEHGAKLMNWTAMPGEEEIIADLRGPELSLPENTPRDYQKELVTKAKDHLLQNGSGWLIMACGSGKTKTSYWIMREVIAALSQSKTLIVIVTPFLQILKQFKDCWSAMNRQYKLKSITGILASIDDKFDKDDYSNYEYLNKETDIHRFLAYPDGVKFIFTTYSSQHKLLDLVKPTITIYDEAHHVKAHKIFSTGKRLFLTATPSDTSIGGVIATYNLRDAINAGFLTPYTIGVFQDDSELEALEYAQLKAKKTIVYCRTNAMAQEFFNSWKDAHPTSNASYVDCKTSAKDRDDMFKKFRTLDKAIIFNCAVLGEGVDLPECDSILIHSGYIGQSRVVQAMGRPLRPSPGKEAAYIYIIDDGRSHIRINAMANYDNEVHSHVKYIYPN